MTLQAHHAVWTTEIWHGDLEECKTHALAGAEIYDQKRHRSHRYLYGGHDPGVCARGTAAIATWFLGYPDQALELTKSGQRLAEDLQHPYSVLITYNDFMEIEMLSGRPEQALQHALRTIEFCSRQNVPNYLAVGDIFAGWAKAAMDGSEQGMRQLDDGLKRYRELGAERNLASYLLLLAELCLRPESCDEGLAAVDEAASLIEHTAEVRWLSEVDRLRGELLLAGCRSNSADAERLFRSAAELASRQSCRSFELRAATSLAGLLQRDGRSREAREFLAPRYGWFTEGFDTADLQRAAALLQALE